MLFAGARYERVCWPAAGGAGDQDAWLTMALEYLRQLHNTMLLEELERRKPRKPRTNRGRR